MMHEIEGESLENDIRTRVVVLFGIKQAIATFPVLEKLK
jgi:hypothetical protein